MQQDGTNNPIIWHKIHPKWVYICHMFALLLITKTILDMNNQAITVFYKWTAKPGKFDELKAIYDSVFKEMNENEPGTLAMHYFFDEEQGALIVNDLFADGQALGAHLGGTAAHHFPKLTEIATPGPSPAVTATSERRVFSGV